MEEFGYLLTMTLREVNNASANSRQRNKRTRARMPKLGIQDPSLACKIDVNFIKKANASNWEIPWLDHSIGEREEKREWKY